MRIQGKHYQTIWTQPEKPGIVFIIDQRFLPHQLVVEELMYPQDFDTAIREMHVRGAPLIGVAAAYGMYSASLLAKAQPDAVAFIQQWATAFRRTRPTAVDLFHAVDRSLQSILAAPGIAVWPEVALHAAQQLAVESAQQCRLIGEHGLPILKAIHQKNPKRPVNVLTHCNAGWIACIDYGTATAPIYMAHDEGIPVHVWVDETRPRNQGARLTAFELYEHGVPHTVIADNTGGHLMQHGMVDLVIVGTDRTTRQGDVANKIGTYLKALAAKDNGVPFYVALPSSTIDWSIADGLTEIPIETRSEKEITHISGWDGEKEIEVQLTPNGSPAVNYGFDVTPARLVTGLITERGVCAASEQGLMELFISS